MNDGDRENLYSTYYSEVNVIHENLPYSFWMDATLLNRYFIKYDDGVHCFSKQATNASGARNSILVTAAFLAIYSHILNQFRALYTILALIGWFIERK